MLERDRCHETEKTKSKLVRACVARSVWGIDSRWISLRRCQGSRLEVSVRVSYARRRKKVQAEGAAKAACTKEDSGAGVSEERSSR